MRFAPGALVLAIWLGGCAAPVAAPTLADATEAEAIELRVTVSDAGCSLEPAGTTSIAAGPIVLVTLNQTDAQAGVDLWRITADGSFGTHGICLRHFDAVGPDPFRPFTTIGPIEAE